MNLKPQTCGKYVPCYLQGLKKCFLPLFFWWLICYSPPKKKAKASQNNTQDIHAWCTFEDTFVACDNADKFDFTYSSWPRLTIEFSLLSLLMDVRWCHVLVHFWDEINYTCFQALNKQSPNNMHLNDKFVGTCHVG